MDPVKEAALDVLIEQGLASMKPPPMTDFWTAVCPWCGETLTIYTSEDLGDVGTSGYWCEACEGKEAGDG